jgi:hypothetical protein
MQFSRNGVSSICDDDEAYFDDGQFVLQMDAQRIHHLLHEALKAAPAFYDTELFKEILGIHGGNHNSGTCCDTNYQSNGNTVICPKCGDKVSLT